MPGSFPLAPGESTGDGRRKCRALHAQSLIQCEELVAEYTTHVGDHYARTTDGCTVHWTDMISVRCECPNGHEVPGSDCLARLDRKYPVNNGAARLSQVGGRHYAKFKIQPWDVIDEYGLGFYAGNALKYLLRAGHKGSRLEDLKKCRHYLDKLIELVEGEDGG